MSSLSPSDKQYLESALRMHGGYVLGFSDRSFKEFFEAFGVDIDLPEYSQYGTSKANRMRTFWKLGANKAVANVLMELSGFIRNEELAGRINKLGFSENVAKIANRLLAIPDNVMALQSTPVTIENNLIHIEIRPEIYEHIKRYLDTSDYFHAVEESYKVVRNKLRSITGHEQAHKAFTESNYEKVFGHAAQSNTESDFFEGVKFLHMALQNFRNEKAHSLAENLDRNLAIHYLSLASLAYDLISRNGA